MPIIAIPATREAWFFSWPDIRAESDAWYDDGRLIVTHPDETRPRPAISDLAATRVIPVPTDVFAKARACTGWSGSAKAFGILESHLPPPPDPLAALAVSSRKKRRIDRKRQVFKKIWGDERDLSRVTRTLVESAVGKPLFHDGAHRLRDVRVSQRFRGDGERRPDETLWAYFTRIFNHGTRPSDLPEKLDKPGDFVGIELEFVPPLDRDVASDEDPISTLRYEDAPFGAEFKHDGSVRTSDDETIDGITEAVILLRPPHWTRLESLCQQLESVGCGVNASCGMHVHIDVRHLAGPGALEPRVKILMESLPVLSTLVKPDRLHGASADRYCRFGISPRLGDPREHYDANRYWAVNLCSVPRQGTVEMRLHHGTLAFSVIHGWATLVRHILLDAPEPLLTLADLDRVAEQLGIADYVAAERRNHRDLDYIRESLVCWASEWGGYDAATGRVSAIRALTAPPVLSDERPLRPRPRPAIERDEWEMPVPASTTGRVSSGDPQPIRGRSVVAFMDDLLSDAPPRPEPTAPEPAPAELPPSEPPVATPDSEHPGRILTNGSVLPLQSYPRLIPADRI